MNNYQLYNTNVLLGGLVCWDITLDSDSEQLKIRDFHVTPVNHHIPYAHLDGAYLLNSKHQYNVKQLYNSTQGYFFKGQIPPYLSHNYPIIIDDVFNSHCNIYEMGCSRTDCLTYGKTYEFLCPVWLEKLADNEYLQFDIIVKNMAGNTVIGKNSILFDYTQYKKSHNDFVDYFRDYIKFVNIDKGNDNLIKLNLSDKTSFIAGLQLNSGNYVTLNNSSLTSNLLMRERPVLETDSMIINSFKLKNLIAVQLFNFRFHFNLDDVFNEYLANQSKYGKFKIDMDVHIRRKVEGKIIDEFETLEKRDLYSNYENITRTYSDSKYQKDIYNGDINALNYLEDNKFIQFTTVNKLYQSVVHWSLCDNNDYIFNLYDGMSGYSYDKTGKMVNHLHLYANAPDLQQPKYSQSLNNSRWCNLMKLNNKYKSQTLMERIKYGNASTITVGELLTEQPIIKEYLTDSFNPSKDSWIHNMKYHKSLSYDLNMNIAQILIEGRDAVDTRILVDLFVNSALNTKVIKCSYTMDAQHHIIIDYNKPVLWYMPLAASGQTNNIIILVSNSLDLLTFASVRKTIKNYVESNKITGLDNLYILHNLMESVQETPAIKFDKSLCVLKASSPSLASTEIYYGKLNNNVMRYVLRYDGKIKPTFLTKEQSERMNIFYYKEILRLDSDRYKLIYKKYLPFKYEPIFPSLNFYAIKSKSMDYDNIYEYVVESEYKWYGLSVIMHIPRTDYVEFNIESERNVVSKETFENALFKCIQLKHNLSDVDTDYVRSRYIYSVLDDYLIKGTDGKPYHLYKVNLNIK